MEWQDLKRALNREIASGAKSLKAHFYELFLARPNIYIYTTDMYRLKVHIHIHYRYIHVYVYLD